MTYDEAKKSFVKTVNDMSGKYPAVTIFSDFVEMAACSLHNAFRKREDLEKKCMQKSCQSQFSFNSFLTIFC